jgi:hypothetical protein
MGQVKTKLKDTLPDEKVQKIVQITHCMLFIQDIILFLKLLFQVVFFEYFAIENTFFSTKSFTENL